MSFINDLKTGKTVNAERNIILSEASHDRDNNYTFILQIEAKEVKFFATYNLLPDGQGKASLDWKISSIDIPVDLQNQKDTVRAIIVEALQEYGLSQMKKNIKKIEVLFSPSI